MLIDDSDIVYIPQNIDAFYPNTHLKYGDVILSKTAIATASFVNLSECNVSQDTVAIKLKKSSKLRSAFLTVFLNTKYGISAMERRFTGNIQMHLNLTECKEKLLIPIFNDIFQESIQKLLLKAISLRNDSSKAYTSAEKILLSALNLENFTPTTENKSVKTFAETFASGRLDAEYYQKKYDEIEERIKGFDHIYAKECIAENNKNYTPLKNEKYTYIELANIENNGGIDDDCIITKGGELPTRARRQVKTDDVIISSVEGSIDKCAIISSKYNKALCSTGFYVMRSSKINSETLLLLFKSNPIQTLMKRGCNGTILMAISREELERIPIPLPAKNIQAKLSTKVKESFALREQSKTLLKAAVKAVETAIEDGEEKAMGYLRENH